ncbi:MAG: enoyl-CoA hydratase-related protein [Myxococcales bacterium]
MALAHRPEYQKLQVQRSDHVATLTLHNPERKNALSPQMVNELLWALDDAKEDPDVRVVVLTGSGAAFCAGADLSQMGSAGKEPALAVRGDFADLLLRFSALGKPVVARVLGPALGGGLGLVASADFAIAAESAVLGTPEIHRGLFPMQIMAVLAPLMPRRKLIELMLVGEKWSAHAAFEAGLLTRVVADGELDAEVNKLSQALSSRSPTAMAHGLRAFHQQHGVPLAESLPTLKAQFLALLGTQDAAEGLAAFLQKREPKWTGK